MISSIGKILQSRPIEEIEAMADYFDAYPRRGRQKKDMLKALEDYFNDAPALWLDRLPESDLRVLSRLCAAGPGTQVEMIPSDYPLVIEVLHIAEFEKSADPDFVKVSIIPEFYSLAHNDIDKIIETKESDGTFAVERMILGSINTYGAVPLRTFVDCLFEDFSDDLSGINDFAQVVAGCPLIRLYQYMYKGESYMVSPEVEDFELLMSKRKKYHKSARRYAVIAPGELSSCGRRSPFCAYGLHTPEGEALTAMLRRVGYEGEELDYALHSVWVNAQFEPDLNNLDILMTPITTDGIVLDSYEDFTDCAQIIIRYANSIPKWLLKGHTAAETGELLYDLPENYFLEDFEAAEMYSEDVLRYFDNANQFRPVAPDDPCPCGSGLSYRLCHGKYVS